MHEKNVPLLTPFGQHFNNYIKDKSWYGVKR